MKYFVKRGEQEYGPYTLADLQLYVQQGNISPQDMARSEGMSELLSVQQIIGNITVPTAQAPFGQPSTGFGAINDPLSASTGMMPNAHLNPPPSLHWGWVLGLSIITCSIFAIIWVFIQAAFVRRLRPDNKAILYLLAYIVVAFGGGFFAASIENQNVEALANIVSVVFYLAAVYSMRSALEDYYNTEENIGLHLSGVITFFVAIFYFQYHFNRITEWKRTGRLPQ